MRVLLCVVLLAGCDHPATKLPPNTPTASVVHPATTKGALLPWLAFDRAVTCSNQVVRHLEVIRVADGTIAWSSKRWGQLVGELSDGDLLVTNLDTEERTGLLVAALSRSDGEVRWSCEATVPGDTTSAVWTPTEHGANGQLQAVYGYGGTPHPPPPILPAFALVVSATGCTLEERPGAAPQPVGLGGSNPTEWTSDDVVLRLGPPAAAGPYTNLTSGPPVQLTATRGGVQLWARELSTPPQVPCLAP